jgi:AcrR family transcriptional regulator
MFTKKRPRGRPRGLSPRGQDVRQRLYDTSIGLMTERGYGGATMREVAQRAGVSVGLLYRYFSAKRSVVMKLYDDLSAELVARAEGMPEGRWTKRFMFALTTSLAVLGPHRAILSALVPVLVGDPEQGLFSTSTAFSRIRVQGVFIEAVVGARDGPRRGIAEALGRLLYLAQLAVILWWLLDRSRDQAATKGLVALIGRTLPAVAAALRLPMVRGIVTAGDALVRQAFFTEE